MNTNLIDYSLIDELWGSSPVERVSYEELLAYIKEAKAEDPDWRSDQTVEEFDFFYFAGKYCRQYAEEDPKLKEMAQQETYE